MSQKHLFEVSYVDRLLRERDEARADAANMSANQCLHGIHGDEYGNPYCPGIAEAEAAGYRRGVQDAARAVKEAQGLYTTKTAEAAVEHALVGVLALLEQTSDTKSPNMDG